MKKQRVLLIMMFVLLVGIICFAGCGKKTTLEEYAKNNPKEFEEVDSSAQNFLKALQLDDIATIDWEIKENDIIFNIQFTSQGEGAVLENMKNSLKTFFESEDMVNNTHTSLSAFNESTSIEDIRMVFNFLNKDGSSIYSKTFD